MGKQFVSKRWKLLFWGFTAAAIVLLLPGLLLELSPQIFVLLGILAAAVFVIGLGLAVYGLRCPACGRSVYHQAMRAQEGIPFVCPKCGQRLEMK